EAAPVLGPVVVHVIEPQELERLLAAAGALDVAAAVVLKGVVAVLTEASLALAVVALLAPRMRALPVRARVELADAFGHAAAGAGTDARLPRPIELARVVRSPGRAPEAVLARAQV